MDNNSFGRINFFTFIDVLVKYKYLFLLSILPPLFVYFFLQTKDITSEFRYVLTLYPKENPKSEQVVKSLENISKDKDILSIAEKTSILIYEDIVKNAFKNIFLSKGAKGENNSNELMYSINNILDSQSNKGFSVTDPKPLLSNEIKNLINSFQTDNLFEAFTQRIDSESFLKEILDKENYENSYLMIEPIEGEKNYLKEYNIITDIELDDKLINLIISSISEQVYNEAFLRVESISNILQNKIDLKIEFLTQIKNSLIVKYVERANIENEKINYERKNNLYIKKRNVILKKIKFDEQNYQRKMLLLSNNYKNEMLYLKSHLRIAEKENLIKYTDIINEKYKDNFELSYQFNNINPSSDLPVINNFFDSQKNDNSKLDEQEDKDIKTNINNFFGSQKNDNLNNDSYYFKGANFIKNKIDLTEKMFELNKDILSKNNEKEMKFNSENLYDLDSNFEKQINVKINNEYDYYLTHFAMNIDLLKDLDFKNKINDVLKESNIDDKLNIISYYNYIKIFQSNSSNTNIRLIAIFVFSFILLYIVFLTSHLYILNKKENKLK